VRYCANPLKY